MNIELIKSEITKLSKLVASWNGDTEISAIERDLALDKLKKLYDMMRFDAATIEQTDTTATPVVTAVSAAIESLPGDEEQSGEQEVEVEFLFAEDDDEVDEELNCNTPDEEQGNEAECEQVEQEDEMPENEEQKSESEEQVPEEQVPEEQEELMDESANELSEPNTDSEDNKTMAVTEETVEEATTEQPKPEPKTESVKEVAAQPATPFTGNLFGMEEPKRPTRSKHLRMMSIYSDVDNERQHTKSVDVSKIFDFDIDMGTTDSQPENVEEEILSTPTPTSSPTKSDIGEKSVTLADTIAANKQTLADTLNTPAPLAEEITHSKIASLMDGVGINDKFLMIRDLFDGDDEAYTQAIHDLDKEESFEDCMIYIVENFEWNPDSEGAKFMMKLLERKHA